MTLLLAPMEGLLDHTLRDILTRVGGIDRCVSEFIRVSGTLLPERTFLRVVPELRQGGRTRAGVPVRAQLLGSDPSCLAENAAKLAALLEKGKRTGEFDVVHPSRTAIWVSGLLSWIALWYHEGGRWSATEVVMDAITMVQKMVQPTGGARV